MPGPQQGIVDYYKSQREADAVEARHQAQLDRVTSLETTFVSVMQEVVDFLNSRTAKAEVTNFPEFPKSIATPDVESVVQAVDKLGTDLGGKLPKDVDLSPVVEALTTLKSEYLEAVKDLKAAVDASRPAEVDLKPLLSAVEGLELKAPDVNVEAPVVNVEAPAAPDVDLEPLKNALDEVVKAVKDIEPTPAPDMTALTELLEKANERLKFIADKPVGGNGDFGVSYQNSQGQLTRATLTAEGRVPSDVTGEVTVSNTSGDPLHITGEVTASGASLAVSEALNFTSQNLLTGAYSGTTSISNDYRLCKLELHFTTSAKRTVTLTTEDGVVLLNDADVTYRDRTVTFDDYFEGGEDLTLAITQTTSACSVSGKLTIAQGELNLVGSPTVQQGTSPWITQAAGFDPVRQWNQFYNVRGQRYIATTGYIQQTLNTSSEPIALLKNPSGSGFVLMLDKAEFGATANTRFSRFGGGTTPLIGTPTARPIGRTDGGTSTSTMQLYTGGNSSPQFSISGGSFVAGTLRKVAAMLAYTAYQLNDIAGTVVLQPGQQAYWVVDEAPGGSAGNFYTYIDFEWVEIPLTTWNLMVTALQAKGDY